MKTVAHRKNVILLLSYVIGYLPKLFFGSTYRISLGVFTERSTRIDFFVMYYSIAISFLILAYCLHYPKGLDKRVTRLILTITSLDLLHLIFLAKQGYGLEKIGLAILIVVGYDLFKKRYAYN